MWRLIDKFTESIVQVRDAFAVLKSLGASDANSPREVILCSRAARLFFTQCFTNLLFAIDRLRTLPKMISSNEFKYVQLLTTYCKRCANFLRWYHLRLVIRPYFCESFAEVLLRV